MTSRVVTLLGLLLAVTILGCAPSSERDAVHVAYLDGTVDGVMERYVDRVLTHAEEHDAALVVFEVDTPGGRLDAMRGIAGRIQSADVPVAAWVGPAGAQAASAGTFIVMSAHVAVMAPSASIGAASPVSGTGEDLPDTLDRKATEDTVAFARGVAETHGRNADWAESAVRDAISASPSAAVDLGVVDLVASSRLGLLEALEGRDVTLESDNVVTLVGLAEKPVTESPMNAYERVLKVIADPLVLSLLLLVGLAGVVIEFFSPGLVLPGTAGVIAIVLAFLGAGTLLPAQAALLLAAVAVALFILEGVAPTGIAATVGGAALLLALGIWAGQASTEVSLGRALVATLVILLAAIGGVALFLRTFLERGDARDHAT